MTAAAATVVNGGGLAVEMRESSVCFLRSLLAWKFHLILLFILDTLEFSKSVFSKMNVIVK